MPWWIHFLVKGCLCTATHQGLKYQFLTLPNSDSAAGNTKFCTFTLARFRGFRFYTTTTWVLNVWTQHYPLLDLSDCCFFIKNVFILSCGGNLRFIFNSTNGQCYPPILGPATHQATCFSQCLTSCEAVTIVYTEWIIRLCVWVLQITLVNHLAISR